MKHFDYKEYIMATIIGNTPKYIQKNILKKIIEYGIAQEGNNGIKGQMVLKNPIDLSECICDATKLKKCIESSNQAIKVIEEWEFNKSYRYSAIFSYSDFNENKIEEIIYSNKAKKFIFENNEFDYIANTIDKPTIYETSDYLFFKFSYGREYFHPRTGEKLKFKYPIIVSVFKGMNVLEVRLDSAPMGFKTQNIFYANLIYSVIDWLGYYLKIRIESVNMHSIIERIKETKQDEINIYSQYMNLKGGGKAMLNVGSDKNYVLPILGELKMLVRNNEDIFKQDSKARDILENFISEIEETSDLPRINLYWKSRDISVEFIHEYMDRNFTLLQYIGEQTDMERMNYVTRYLIQNRIMD